MKIEDLEGIGDAYGAKLRQAGINSPARLLERGRTPQGRAEIATRCGLSPALVLRWVNMADLCRVRGIGGEFAELLECAGVDTVKELRNRNAESLAQKVAIANEEKKLTRRVPSTRVVSGWIEQAQQLPPKLEY